MKKTNNVQRFYLVCMIGCMIFADIFVCFNNPILIILGYGFFLAAIYLGFYQ